MRREKTNMNGVHSFVLTPTPHTLSIFQRIHCIELKLLEFLPLPYRDLMARQVRMEIPYDLEYSIHLNDHNGTTFQGTTHQIDTTQLITYPHPSRSLVPGFMCVTVRFAKEVCDVRHMSCSNQCVWSRNIFLNIMPVIQRPEETCIQMVPQPRQLKSSSETNATPPLVCVDEGDACDGTMDDNDSVDGVSVNNEFDNEEVDDEELVDEDSEHADMDNKEPVNEDSESADMDNENDNCFDDGVMDAAEQFDGEHPVVYADTSNPSVVSHSNSHDSQGHHTTDNSYSNVERDKCCTNPSLTNSRSYSEIVQTKQSHKVHQPPAKRVGRCRVTNKNRKQ